MSPNFPGDVPLPPPPKSDSAFQSFLFRLEQIHQKYGFYLELSVKQSSNLKTLTFLTLNGFMMIRVPLLLAEGLGWSVQVEKIEGTFHNSFHVLISVNNIFVKTTGYKVKL